MAKMIPNAGPRDRDGNLKYSREADVYEALATLPDDYWVIHSYKMVTVKDEALKEREADFVVFHPELGILCIEAKAGNVYYKNDQWRYGNGKPMRNQGPYQQASTLKYSIMSRFQDCGCKDLVDNCKIASAVWFLSIRESSLNDIGIASDADRAITLSLDDLANPEPKIRQIFSVNVNGRQTNLNRKQAQQIIEQVLCPSFNITPTAKYEYDIAETAFVRLLDSQIRVLDFIADESSAAIRGAAGTGKTLIAVEYAKRMSAKNERTLFLCKTTLLSKDVQGRLRDAKNVDVFTIDSYAESFGAKQGSPSDKCRHLGASLMQAGMTGGFPYQHVIIDEGQDFGEDYIRDNEIVETLEMLVGEHKNGTMYMFYDDRQKSLSKQLPEFINTADCKLTLHVNCRNSRDVAECAIRGADVTFKQNARYKAEGVPVGGKPQLFVSDDVQDQRSYIDNRIRGLQDKGLTDIAIVTCKNINSSALKGYVTRKRGRATWGNAGIPFTTFTKFKGMEADAVILVDMDASVWKLNDFDQWLGYPTDLYTAMQDRHFITWLEERTEPAISDAFYIAASRAKFELSIVCNMDENECSTLVYMLCERPGRKPVSKLAKLLHAEKAALPV